MGKSLIAVIGPTAIGKTAWAIEIANHYDTEIISADSRQFYREMAIGTAVPSKEDLQKAKHHFIQHISIQRPWSVGDFEKAALNCAEQILRKKDTVVVVGGSGLYVQALTEGLDHFPDVDPAIRKGLNEDLDNKGIQYLQEQLKEVDPRYYSAVDLQNPHRLIRALEVFRSSGKPFSSYLDKPKKKRPFNTIYVGVTANKEFVYKKIEDRVDLMIKSGLLDEVKKLYKYRDLTALQTVGYQELFSYLDGKCSLEEAVREIKKNTRRFAKRQMTWFRKNKDIIWIQHNEELDSVLHKIESTKLKVNSENQ